MKVVGNIVGEFTPRTSINEVTVRRSPTEGPHVRSWFPESPGFHLLSEDLQTYREKSAALNSGRLQKVSLTATQAILYFDSFAPGDTVRLSFRLRAKYPIRARTFPSRAYEYYEPEVNAVARPVELEIRKK